MSSEPSSHENVPAGRTESRTLVRMLAVALVVRVALGSFIDASGFDTDLMQSWTRTLLDAPLSEFYAVAEGPDHLPGDLWFLWLIGHGLELIGLDNAPRGPFVALLKLVPAIADVLIAWELFVLVRSFATQRAALIVAAAFAFNPGGIFLTSIWGQWDAVSMALLLGGVLVIAWTSAPHHDPSALRSLGMPAGSRDGAPSHYRHPELVEGSPREALGGVADVRRPKLPPRSLSRHRLRREILGFAQDDIGERGHGQGQTLPGGAFRFVPIWPVAVPMFTWAVLIKPPLALVAGVFVLYASARTMLNAPSVRDAIVRTSGAVVASLLLGIATASLIILPFDVGLPGMATRWDVLERAQYALDLYPFTTLQAANIWMIKDAHLYRPGDADGTLLGLTERSWGSVLLALALAWIAAVVVAGWRRLSEVTLVVWAALATSYAIFMLPTRVHERYFFPVIVLALALAGLEAGGHAGQHTGHSFQDRLRGASDDMMSPDGARWTWRLAITISTVVMVSLLLAYDHTVNAIRAALFDVPLAFLFRTVAIVNLGVFLITMALPLWWGRRNGYSSR